MMIVVEIWQPQALACVIFSLGIQPEAYGYQTKNGVVTQSVRKELIDNWEEYAFKDSLDFDLEEIIT